MHFLRRLSKGVRTGYSRLETAKRYGLHPLRKMPRRLPHRRHRIKKIEIKKKKETDCTLQSCFLFYSEKNNKKSVHGTLFLSPHFGSLSSLFVVYKRNQGKPKLFFLLFPIFPFRPLGATDLAIEISEFLGKRIQKTSKPRSQKEQSGNGNDGNDEINDKIG